MALDHHDNEFHSSVKAVLRTRRKIRAVLRTWRKIRAVLRTRRKISVRYSVEMIHRIKNKI